MMFNKKIIIIIASLLIIVSGLLVYEYFDSKTFPVGSTIGNVSVAHKT